ncbi:MAG: hypothetical protein LBE84_05370, partial [Planctomycetota bacterium]|nr:hypothetical protein [Planctomycetota bacterium]
MSRLDETLDDLAPRVSQCMDIPGEYNPRHCLAIYCFSAAGESFIEPGKVLGDAISMYNPLGCVMLEGLPAKIPGGAILVARYDELKRERPDLLEGMPEISEPGQYAIRLGRSALIVSLSHDGLSAGMHTLAMILLRYGKPLLPGSVIMDKPTCQCRGLALELTPKDIEAGTLIQIASFAATFRANRLHVILPADFEPTAEIPGINAFIALCRSFGIETGVRLPWLADILSGRRGLRQTWSRLRVIARMFGASQASLDDA